MSNNEKDYYYDLYSKSRLSNDEVRQHKEFENFSDRELNKISDMIFDLAIVAQKIITETNE